MYEIDERSGCVAVIDPAHASSSGLGRDYDGVVLFWMGHYVPKGVCWRVKASILRQARTALLRLRRGDSVEVVAARYPDAYAGTWHSSRLSP